MNIFLIILFTILIPACAYGLLRYLVVPMPKSSERTLLFIVTPFGALLFSVLLVLSTFIPGKINAFIDVGIAKVEENVSNISPGYIYEEQDTESIKTFLSNYKQIQAGLESNEDARFLTELIGVNVYIKALNLFASGIDCNLREMEEDHIPVTLHNIFLRIQEKSKDSIVGITQKIEIAILIVTLIFFIVIGFACLLARHDMSGDAKVRIAEETDKTVPQPQTSGD